ncbi:MAG TPA: ABC transporter permease [Anaerolineae bacterium]|nr:ABC transporter permease [Anaerolineae bacterium]HQK12414.1 ABC transporter permease [Anaerolineae bacterium]
MGKHLKELWTYRELVYNLVVRDLKVRYKNSLLGVLWSWLNPLLMMLIFTFVFGYMWRNRTIPHPHILFLSALLPWNFFTGAVMGGIQSVVGSSSLVKKVYFPREVLPISVVLSNLINFLISLPVLLILIILSGIPLTGWLLLLPLPILIQVTFAIGIVLFLSALEVFYRDTHMMMDVGMQAWFFLTPIVYTYRDLPQKATLFGVTFNPQIWLFRLNPMASIINTYQDLLYNGALTQLDFLARTAVTALLVLILGYWFFIKHSKRFGEMA